MGGFNLMNTSEWCFRGCQSPEPRGADQKPALSPRARAGPGGLLPSGCGTVFPSSEVLGAMWGGEQGGVLEPSPFAEPCCSSGFLDKVQFLS